MRSRVAVVAVTALVVLAGFVGGPIPGEDRGEEIDASDADGELEIHHLDVGQADATLIVTPADETILIDTGDWRADGRDVIDYLEAQGIDRIDHLVATHAHADHIGGHAAVIEHLEEHGAGVGAAYDSGVVHTSQTYENYLDAVETYDVRLFEVVAGDELPLEDDAVTATVLNPPEHRPPDGDADDLHDNSVTLVVAFGGVSYLTTGDAERDVERRLADDYGDALAADVYQAGHHGSSTSSSEPFLEAVAPDLAVLSSALDSQYGHPHDEVLEALADRGVETYWTAVHGDVVITTDGDDVSVDTDREGPTDATALLERKHDVADEPSIGSPSTAGPPVAAPSVDPAPAAHPTIDPAAGPLSGR